MTRVSCLDDEAREAQVPGVEAGVGIQDANPILPGLSESLQQANIAKLLQLREKLGNLNQALASKLAVETGGEFSKSSIGVLEKNVVLVKLPEEVWTHIFFTFLGPQDHGRISQINKGYRELLSKHEMTLIRNYIHRAPSSPQCVSPPFTRPTSPFALSPIFSPAFTPSNSSPSVLSPRQSSRALFSPENEFRSGSPDNSVSSTSTVFSAMKSSSSVSESEHSQQPLAPASGSSDSSGSSGSSREDDSNLPSFPQSSTRMERASSHEMRGTRKLAKPPLLRPHSSVPKRPSPEYLRALIACVRLRPHLFKLTMIPSDIFENIMVYTAFCCRTAMFQAENRSFPNSPHRPFSAHNVETRESEEDEVDLEGVRMCFQCVCALLVRPRFYEAHPDVFKVIFKLIIENMRAVKELFPESWILIKNTLPTVSIHRRFIQTMLRPYLRPFRQHNTFELNHVHELGCLLELIPKMFAPSLADKLLEHLGQLFSSLVAAKAQQDQAESKQLSHEEDQEQKDAQEAQSNTVKLMEAVIDLIPLIQGGKRFEHQVFKLRNSLQVFAAAETSEEKFASEFKAALVPRSLDLSADSPPQRSISPQTGSMSPTTGHISSGQQTNILKQFKQRLQSQHLQRLQQQQAQFLQQMQEQQLQALQVLQQQQAAFIRSLLAEDIDETPTHPPVPFPQANLPALPPFPSIPSTADLPPMPSAPVAGVAPAQAVPGAQHLPPTQPLNSMQLPSMHSEMVIPAMPLLATMPPMSSMQSMQMLSSPSASSFQPLSSNSTPSLGNLGSFGFPLASSSLPSSSASSSSLPFSFPFPPSVPSHSSSSSSSSGSLPTSSGDVRPAVQFRPINAPLSQDPETRSSYRSNDSISTASISSWFQPPTSSASVSESSSQTQSLQKPTLPEPRLSQPTMTRSRSGSNRSSLGVLFFPRAHKQIEEF